MQMSKTSCIMNKAILFLVLPTHSLWVLGLLQEGREL